MKFQERFDLNIGFEEAQQRFVNRLHNEVWLKYFRSLSRDWQDEQSIAIATAIGERRNSNQRIEAQIGADLLTNLRAVEAFYAHLDLSRQPTLKRIVEAVLAQSEFDLGIEWRDGAFFRTGAAVLDENLVNDVLHWLCQPGYESALKPFKKGLRHLLEAHVKKEHLQDVITDVYEALEGLAKIVTGRDRDLSGNRESFISATKASDAYKVLMKNYIDYANRFRHAESEVKPKPEVTEREVESFVYMTGIFMRLAMP